MRARSRVQRADRCDDAGVCREWRCKYEGDKATSASLEACSKVLDEYLPELKKIDGVTVNRAAPARESQSSRRLQLESTRGAATVVADA